MNLQTATPVVVLGGGLGGLAIARTLGKLGIAVHVVDSDPRCPAILSKYCVGRHLLSFDEAQPQPYYDGLVSIGQRFAERPLLIPTADELSIFVASHASSLSRLFRFPELRPDLVSGLASKKTMFSMAQSYGVPTALAAFPSAREDVARYAEAATFPVMLKGIFGNRLAADSGKKMLIVGGPDELLTGYDSLAAFDPQNIMIQEYIPGEDSTVFIFNGYFNLESDCLAAFTGRKIRQFPIHVGCASLGECTWNEEVNSITTRFMKQIGYRGILDIGYRYDARDGQYKVLDINPRVGQAFRLFVDRDGMDVVRALYLDLTGQRVPRSAPREGRRWMIEDFDLISTFHYFQEGTISPRQWVSSFKGLEECMYFDAVDMRPFLNMSSALSVRAVRYVLKRARAARPRSTP